MPAPLGPSPLSPGAHGVLIPGGVHNLDIKGIMFYWLHIFIAAARALGHEVAIISISEATDTWNLGARRPCTEG